MSKPPADLLTIKEAAIITRKSTKAIYRMIEARKITAYGVNPTLVSTAEVLAPRKRKLPEQVPWWLRRYRRYLD